MADVFREVALDMMAITFALNSFTASRCHVKVFLCHNCCSDFVISFALLSYFSGVEASCAPTYVRDVLFVSRACFRYDLVYLLCAELTNRHGNDFILVKLLWHWLLSILK